MMLSDPVFTLLSLESQVPRPRVLRQGTLAECFDELREAGLHDANACNPARLAITVTDPLGGPGATRTLFRISSTGDGI